MKKSIIFAGTVSALMAAMPVVGAFASRSSVTDHISVSVADYCSFKDGTGNNTDVASGIAPGSLHVYSTALNPMVVICSSNYKITPTMTSLTAVGVDASSNILFSSTTATGGSKTWSASYEVGGDATPDVDAGNFENGVAINGYQTVSVDGDIWVVTYKVGLDGAQPSGTYTGTATYVLETRN